MKLHKLIYLIVCCVAFVIPTWAQDTTIAFGPRLSLEDVINLTLKNNYDIQLVRNNEQAARTNVSVGNAGILPVITGDVTSNNSVLTTNQSYSDGSKKSFENAKNLAITYGVNLNWRVFDGLAMFANYKELKQLDDLAKNNIKDTILSTVANAVITYYQMASQQQQVRAVKYAVSISRLQVRLANDKFEAGTASRLEVLNAQVNYNADTTNLLTQLQQYKNNMIYLNQLMVRDLQTDFSVADTILIDDKLTLGNVLEQAQDSNLSIISAQLAKNIAQTNLKQTKATRYPTLDISTGYNLSNSRNPAAFATEQNSHGLYYGLSASVNIFNGLNQWRREKNAKLNVQNYELREKMTHQNIEAQISTQYTNYVYGINLTTLHKSNIEIAKRNLDITMEKYKVGNITTLEVREAQRNFLDAQSNYAAAQFQTKMAEIMLKEATGKGIPIQMQ